MTVTTDTPGDPPRGAAAIGGDELIDVRSVVATLRRRWRLIAAVTAVIFGLACLVLANATPVYTATAQVVLERAQERIVTVESVTADLPPDSPTVDTEVQVLRSPELAGRVVDALGLARDPDFNGGARPRTLVSRLRVALTGGPAEAQQPPSPQQARASAIGKVLGGLEVQREGLTYAINITYQSTSPRTAASVANAVAEQYIGGQLTERSRATTEASGWLSSRLSGLRAQVEAAEAAVQRYRAANGLLNANGDTTVTQQELSNLNGRLSEARAVQAEREAELATARGQLARGSTGEDVGEALGSPVVGQLRTQRADISRQLADLEGRYGPRHPELLRLRRELADLDAQIGQEIGRRISNLEAEAEVARQRTASLSGSLNQARGVLAANDNASVRLAELERNAEAARAVYQSFLDRYRQTTAQQGVEQPRARIIARAAAPRTPTSPQPALILAGGLGGGLVLAFALVFLLQMFEGGLATAESVERRLAVPCLGSVPDLATTLDRRDRARRTPPGRFLLERPLSAFAEAFRMLRSNLVHARGGGSIQVVAVTSALPGEGKSTTAMGLVRTAALGGTPAVLLDCDTRRREDDGPGSEPGLVEVLTGKATLDEALRADVASGAFWLTAAGAPQVLVSWFESSAMDALLGELRARFPLVVLDTPPVLPVAESRVLAAKADAVVLVVRWRRTPREAAEAALRALRMVDAPVSGAALTLVDVREQARTGDAPTGRFTKTYDAYFR